MPKVRMKAYVKYEEVRDVDLTDDEFAALQDFCDRRIEQAFEDDEGEFVESSTISIHGDSWELIEPKVGN